MASVAALGGEFGLELLQAVTDQDEADVREALDELCEPSFCTSEAAPTSRLRL